MTVYSAFAPSILGMQSQAHSLSTISQNVANATTGGFKKTETRFQTVLSDTIGNSQDFGGVLPKDIQMIGKQGLIYTTARDLDLAIVGQGFFVVSDALTGGNTFYSRDGSFDMQVTTASTGGSSTSVPGYLVDKNGFYLMGWAPDTSGVFPTSGTPTAMRIDPDYFANTFESTTKAEIGLNLPAGADLITNHATAVATVNSGGTAPAGYHSYSIGVIDSAGKKQSVRFNFTRNAQNSWQVSATHSQTPVKQVDTVTLAGTVEPGDSYTVTVSGTTYTYTHTGATATIDTARDALIALINADTNAKAAATSGGTGIITLTAKTAGTAITSSVSDTSATSTTSVATTTANTPNYTTTTTTTIPFTNTGFAGTASGSTVTPPNAISYALTFNGGSTVSFNLDVAAMTQFDSGFLALMQTTNGFEKSSLERLSWDEKGYLIGGFTNDNSRRLYRVPLASFVSPDNLEMLSGMVFRETEKSGPPKIEAADASGRAAFSPGAIEQSNVDIAEEFTRMIMTQAAYNASSVAFRTNDEMTMTARDLFKG